MINISQFIKENESESLNIYVYNFYANYYRKLINLNIEEEEKIL